MKEKDNDLFVIGNGDILIKKRDKKTECSCKQSSFEYNGKENVLIGRKGMFEVKNIEVIGLQLTEDEKKTKEKYNITANQMKQLETWCNLKCGELIFDSTKHGWSKENNEFRKKIFNKSKVCIVIENEDGEIFGCYINSTIDKVYEYPDDNPIKDENAFVFNLESNGRHEGPMKFDIKKEEFDHVFSLCPDDDLLFGCGYYDILIYKENEKSKSYCKQWKYSDFDYRGVEKALVQNPYNGTNDKESEFTPKRIIVIQMI